MGKKKKLTKRELTKFQKLLLNRRRELLKQVGEQDEDIDELRGDTSADPFDMAGNYSQIELMTTLGNQERTELAEIDHALEKIEEGTYGLCEESGELINLLRLEAMPTARYSLEVQEQRERLPGSYQQDRPRRRALISEDLPVSTDDDDA